jgi:tetratricopeptide (TPR) repeat protein
MSEKPIESSQSDDSNPSSNSVFNGGTDHKAAYTNGSFNSSTGSPAQNKPPIALYLGLGSLAVVALFVIFVLPSIVSEYELPLERRVDSAALVPVPSTPVSNISPFEESQRAIARKEAQDVLAALLTIQAELTDFEVEQWGQVAFESALAQAAMGDEYYRTQDFALATESYEAGKAELESLLESVPAELAQTLVEAEAAFNADDAAQAQLLYSLALVFDPLNEEANKGLERSQVLSDVNSLLAQAEDFVEDNALEDAQAAYREAVSLDSYNEQAPAGLTKVAGLIRERDFARVMSKGYVLLESGDPDAAIAVFKEASNMGLNKDQALAAIAQTENEIANAEINALRTVITSAEASEQWQTAVGNYDQVLAIDPNLTFAIEGRDYASKRERLNSLLGSAIDNPERLSEDDVFQQTLDVYYTGRAIDNPGPVLIGQLDSLEVFLENSQVPIDIQFISDNLTDVTLLRIASLGMFERHEMPLKPGRYVAVGKRPGYREVRQEFVVGFNQTPSLVIVKCDERVVATKR